MSFATRVSAFNRGLAVTYLLICLLRIHESMSDAGPKNPVDSDGDGDEDGDDFKENMLQKDAIKYYHLASNLFSDGYTSISKISFFQNQRRKCVVK